MRRSHEGDNRMKFLLLIYDEEKRWNALSPEEQGSEGQGFFAFGKEFERVIHGGNALQPTPTAKTVRVRGGKPMVTDGPFAETKEQLGGYYLVEANDINEAAKIAANIPWAKSGSVEVRPIMVFE
jgi:hypothetical protein